MSPKGMVSLFILALVTFASLFLSGSAHPEVVSILSIIALSGLLCSLGLHRGKIKVPRNLFLLLATLLTGVILQWMPLQVSWSKV